MLIASWYWRRSRRSKIAVEETSKPSEYQKPELAATEAQRYELAEHQRAELGVNEIMRPPYELAENREVPENETK